MNTNKTTLTGDLKFGLLVKPLPKESSEKINSKLKFDGLVVPLKHNSKDSEKHELSSFINNLKKELSSISENQTKILETIKTVKEGELSIELKTLFKKEKIDISDARKAYVNIQLDNLEEDLQNQSYKSKTKLISKSNNEKLKRQFKQFQSVLKPAFICKLRKFDFNNNEDTTATISFITQLSSFIYSVKELKNKPEITSTK